MRRKSKKKRIYVYVELIHFAVQYKLIQYCKATILQLKKKFFFKGESINIKNKIIKHVKKQENLTITRKKLVDRNRPKMTGKMELEETDFRTIIINMFKNSKENINTMRTKMGKL